MKLLQYLRTTHAEQFRFFGMLENISETKSFGVYLENFKNNPSAVWHTYL